jgi:carboxymethylenebutenolidase
VAILPWRQQQGKEKLAMSTWYDDPMHALRIDSSEGNFDAYHSWPRMQKPPPAIVVLHEVFGVNEDLRATCDELAAVGFIAICPELFWRHQSHVDLSVRSQSDWEKGVALYTAFDIDSGVRDVEATIAAARALRAGSGRVGVMGYCLGGLLTFLTAARTSVDAAVAFHGARTEEFLAETADIDAPLQMHLAEEDEFISKAAQQQIAAALSSEAKFEVFSYPGCGHAFSRHGGMHFDADAARLSRTRVVDFFKRHLT